MALVLIQEPEMLTRELYESTTEKIGVHDDPPEGLIVHTAGEIDGGRLRIVDVWETREAYHRFRDERLLPAIQATMEERGMEMPGGPPGAEPYEVFDLVRGR